nr:MAG TPA: hypothetical protein [Caudoviricetes sp.]DAQ99408.1 MAG TPA: hypothetical protein [Caudoviricetes sp.]
MVIKVTSGPLLVTNSHNSVANRTKSVHLQRSFFMDRL